MRNELERQVWRAGVALAVWALAGCEAAAGPVVESSTWHSVPGQLQAVPNGGYPTEIEYKILAVAHGEACAAVSAAKMEHLLTEAEYKAIESVPDADSVMLARTRWASEGGKVCVYLTGRAYRIVRLHARPAAGQASPEAK